MISRAQQILIKQAQREAGLADDEYRDALEAVSGCRSTKDRRLTDRHVDLTLAYFEAIYWRGIDAGTLQPSCKTDAVFRQRGFWAAKNPGENTSRDRYSHFGTNSEIDRLEQELSSLGFTPAYRDAIRRNVTQGRSDLRSLHAYKAALKRTIAAKRNKFAAAEAAQSKA